MSLKTEKKHLNHVTAIIFMVNVLGLNFTSAQVVRFYPSQLNTYPKSDEIVNGLLQVDTSMTNINFIIRVANENGPIVDTQIHGNDLVSGINSFKLSLHEFLKLNETVDGYLWPGCYEVAISYKLHDSLNEEKNILKIDFTVPPFTVSTTTIGDSILIVNRSPASIDGQIYLKVRTKGGSSFSKQSYINILVSDTFKMSSLNTKLNSYHYYEAFWFCSGKLVSKINASSNNEPFNNPNRFSSNLFPRLAVSFSGLISLECYYANTAFPNQLTSTNYTRLIVEPNISINGIPFSIKLKLNTNNSSIYPNDIFKFDFNSEKFRKNIEQSLIQEQTLLQQKVASERNDIRLYSESRNRLKNKLKRWDLIDSLGESLDSFNVGVLKSRKNRAEQELRSLDDKISHLERNVAQDSIKLNKLYDTINVDDSVGNLINQTSRLNYSKVLSRINGFSVGSQSKFITSFLFAYRPINGLFLDYRISKASLKLLVGKSIFNSPTNLSPNGYFTSILIRLSKNEQVRYSQIGFSVNNTRERRNNVVTSIGNFLNISKNIQLKSELAFTLLDTLNFSIDFASRNIRYKLDKLAFNSEINAKTSATSEVRLGVKYVGNSYQSLGVVNLNNDWAILNLYIRKRYFRSRLVHDLTIERAESNISAFKNNTSILNTIGTNIKIKVNKLPDMNVSYRYLQNTVSYHKIWENGVLQEKFNVISTILYVGLTDNLRVRKRLINYNLGFTNISSLTFHNNLKQRMANLYLMSKLGKGNSLNYKLTLSQNLNLNYFAIQNDLSLNSTFRNGKVTITNGLVYAKTNLNGIVGSCNFTAIINNPKSIISFRSGLSYFTGRWYESPINLVFNFMVTLTKMF